MDTSTVLVTNFIWRKKWVLRKTFIYQLYDTLLPPIGTDLVQFHYNDNRIRSDKDYIDSEIQYIPTQDIC